MTYPQNPATPSGWTPPAPMPAPAKKRKWPWILGGLVGLMLIGCIGAVTSGGTDTAEPADGSQATTAAEGPAAVAPKKTEKAKDDTPGLNHPAADGDFQFTVTGVKCGVSKVGTSLLGQAAQGQFCLISVQVKNIGKEAQTFLDSAQKAYDAKKVEYSVDSSAALYANGDQQILFAEINPGNTVKGKLVFDVPEGPKLTSLELHDSPFSGGVRVSLK
ncbi:hypothetical protein AMIS_67050 [Actinoplanes missouriensis 431]|uniref:DUF4352 domain-containing protein n=1 Tax=Actinoplanes missouriensis (strain ATCC 14538 / DSM 43046 / CBS 188.64 / JCM 3121 / NBRC 102363 / NCIMB 12654 / NRRL B-3342 / UNCC 431) TaxID=512565 RepID=I0HFY8_ACTM4|nr:DUF4352 domain-containing protein [Actinoplanes missouriensis]BAL91925.1 hypothetical protein AMIS_67050 [Actinoplanes missouriensis 431]